MMLEKIRSLCQQAYRLGNYDQVYKCLTFVEASKGRVKGEMRVGVEHTNDWGGLHGGMSSSLVDHLTTVALRTHFLDQERPPKSVSLELSLSFLAPANVGDTIVIDAETIRVGRKIAFLRANITNKENNKLLVTAKHTKFLS